MFLPTGSLSALPRPGLVLLGGIFALGIAAGTAMGPLLSAPASAIVATPLPPVGSAAQARDRAAHPADVLRILDGDTFEARVHVWPGLDITTKVRLRGIDAPELKSRCPQERAKAEAARNALAAMLAEGGVEIGRVGLDKFGGRVDADASTKSTPDISAALLRAGLARAYDGGRRAGWCGAEARG